MGVAALRGQHRVRRARLRDWITDADAQGAVPRLRGPPDQLRARRQPARSQLHDRLRRQPAAEPAPPHRARLVDGQPPDRPTRRGTSCTARSSAGPTAPERRLHRQPRRLRDERGGHRLQRRASRRALARLYARVRRHAAGRLPVAGAARRRRDLPRGRGERVGHQLHGDPPLPQQPLGLAGAHGRPALVPLLLHAGARRHPAPRSRCPRTSTSAQRRRRPHSSPGASTRSRSAASA